VAMPRKVVPNGEIRNPWPRPGMQGPSSIAFTSEVSQRQHGFRGKSRQGRPNTRLSCIRIGIRAIIGNTTLFSVTAMH